jgi:hypothetical protein
LFATTLVVAVALPAAASATIFSGVTADPAGDGPSPSLDITRTEVRYDSRQGSADFTIRLAAPPAGNLQVSTGLGRTASDGSCGAPMILAGAFLPDGQTIWLLDQDGVSPPEEQDEGTRSISGSTLTVKASDPRLGGLEPNCALAVLSNPDDTTVVYDESASYAVKPPPPKPRLTAKISSVGSLRRKASKLVSVRVSNKGQAAARKVVVRAKIRGAASLRPRVRKLGTIRAGKTGVARFRIRVSARGKGKVSIAARVTGRKVKAAASTSFRIKVPKRSHPTHPVSNGSLAGKIYWGFESYRFDHSADLVFLHFTNGKFVRWSTPGSNLKPCARVTAKVKDGEMQPGCLRYSYDRRSGKVRIGNVRGTYRGGKLKLKMDDDIWPSDGGTWFLGLLAKPSTRFGVDLINRGYSGACGITPYCSTWSEFLLMTRDGRFGRTESWLTTGGTPGGVFVAISNLGPDEKGHYKILRGGRIRFNYASGRKTTENLIVQTDKRGRPDPVHEGLLVGDLWFYEED